jgi:hypothetical protein
LFIFLKIKDEIYNCQPLWKQQRKPNYGIMEDNRSTKEVKKIIALAKQAFEKKR